PDTSRPSPSGTCRPGSRPWNRRRGSLAGYGDPVALLGRDQVVRVLGVVAQVDLDPPDVAVELAVVGSVVVAHRRGRVDPDVGRLVARERHGFRALDAALPDRGAVEVERHRATLREAAAVVRELHPDLVLPCRDRGVPVDLEAPDAE